MAVITDPSCARWIEPTAPEEMTEAFARELYELASDPEARRRMGANARARLEREFRWDQKADFMASLFKEIEGGGT
jgi:glycosyltransferase involved in cell wall biosynthesis